MMLFDWWLIIITWYIGSIIHLTTAIGLNLVFVEFDHLSNTTYCVIITCSCAYIHRITAAIITFFSNWKCLSPTENVCLQPKMFVSNPKRFFLACFFCFWVKSVFNATFLPSIQLKCKCNNASGCNIWHYNLCTKDTLSW